MEVSSPFSTIDVDEEEEEEEEEDGGGGEWKKNRAIAAPWAGGAQPAPDTIKRGRSLMF
jgi:hypothetical protein